MPAIYKWLHRYCIAMFLVYLAFTIELLSALIGFIKRKTLNNKGIKFFPVFLFFQFLNQLASSLYNRIFHLGNNLWMYNIFMLFDMACFAYLFYHILEKQNFKKAVVILTTAFYAFYLIDRFILQVSGEYLSYSRSFMGFNLVVFSLLYFYNLFDFTKPEENLTHKVDFWIVIGIFFFYLTSTIILGITNYLSSIKFNELLKFYNPNTMKFLAMALYSFYIVGFLCHKPKTQQI